MRFLDGPAQGTILDLRRAPLYLRVVINDAGVVDALDQTDDTPTATETIHVYPREGQAVTGFLDYRDRHGRRCGRPFATGDYRLHNVQPDDATARDTHAWREWASAQRRTGVRHGSKEESQFSTKEV